MKEFAVVIICYLIGSIPFSYMVTAWLGKKDIRKHGSGNVGATNVLRTVGLKYAALAILGDIFKGVVAAWLALYLDGGIWLIFCPLAAVIGHCYPIYLRFKGGKGVATSAGVLIVLLPAALGILVAVFVITILIGRRVSLGSILGAAAAPFVAFFLYPDQPFLTVLILMLALLVIFRHQDNIKRLRAGTEPRIGEKAK